MSCSAGRYGTPWTPVLTSHLLQGLGSKIEPNHHPTPGGRGGGVLCKRLLQCKCKQCWVLGFPPHPPMKLQLLLLWGGTWKKFPQGAFSILKGVANDEGRKKLPPRQLYEGERDT